MLTISVCWFEICWVYTSVHEDYEIDLGSWAWRVTDMYTENEVSLYGKHL